MKRTKAPPLDLSGDWKADYCLDCSLWRYPSDVAWELEIMADDFDRNAPLLVRFRYPRGVWQVSRAHRDGRLTEKKGRFVRYRVPMVDCL